MFYVDLAEYVDMNSDHDEEQEEVLVSRDALEQECCPPLTPHTNDGHNSVHSPELANR